MGQAPLWGYISVTMTGCIVSLVPTLDEQKGIGTRSQPSEAFQFTSLNSAQFIHNPARPNADVPDAIGANRYYQRASLKDTIAIDG